MAEIKESKPKPDIPLSANSSHSDSVTLVRSQVTMGAEQRFASVGSAHLCLVGRANLINDLAPFQQACFEALGNT